MQATIPPLASLQLAAAGAGANKAVVSWEVLEGRDAGTISDDGLFKASKNEGTYHVRASLDDLAHEEVEITVSRNAESPLVEVLPNQVVVNAGERVQFSGHALGTFDTRIEWSTSGGTISDTGLFTAPLTAGQIVVTVKSLAHPNKLATAKVTVVTRMTSVTLALAPLAVEVVTGATVQFTASVGGTSDHRVAWSVEEANGGTVETSGMYKAPSAPGMYHVTVLSLAATAVTQTAIITVLPKPADPVSVAIAPLEVSLMAGQSLPFSVAVLGDSASDVSWSIEEGLAGGTITAAGEYIAPLVAGIYHVVVTSTLNAAASATATVTVYPYISPIAIAIAPNEVTLMAGSQVQFAKALTGVTNPSVDWAVVEGAAGGSISLDGLYAAPGTAGTYHVTVVSVEDPDQLDTATITVLPYVSPVTVSIAPTALTLQAGQSFDFEAAVAGAENKTVDWVVVEGSGGAISVDGLYSAPLVTGMYHVKAKSQADSSVWAVATVTVVPYEATVAIALSPLSATVRAGSTFAFEASLAGATDTTVVWSVDEGAAGGSVDASGTYTAPITPGTFHVRAVAAAEASVEAVATVTVSPAQVAVSVIPLSATLQPAATQQFTPDVAGAANGVYWTVVELDGGVISSNGLYTAPSTGGTYHIKAVSKDDPSASAEATITVLAPVEVGISPASATVVTNSTLTFAAFVTGSANSGVAWSVTQQQGGTIDPDGTYHAPATKGTYHVRATSLADNLAFHEVTVRVVPDGVWLEVTAPTEKILFGGTTTMKADVFGTAETSVTWWLPVANTGNISQTGVYTAPATGGVYRVRATSVDNPMSFSETTVTVQGPWLRKLDLGSTNSGLSALKRHADGTYWAVGWKQVTTPYETLYYGWLAHLAPDGETILKETLLSYVTLYDLAFMANGNILAVGASSIWSTGAVDGVAIALTQNMTPVWAKSYGDSSRNDYFQFVHTVDGNTFFIGGQSNPTTYTDDRTALLRIDDTGAILSESSFATSPGRLVARPDGSFFILTVYNGARALDIRKFSSTGAIQWGKSLANFRHYDALPGAWGGIAISGLNYDLSQSGIVEFDGQGNIVWGTGLGSGSNTRLHASGDGYTLIDKRSYVYANVLWFAGFTTTGTVSRQGELAGSSAYTPAAIVDNGRGGFVITSTGQNRYPFLLDLTEEISPGLPPSSGFTYCPTSVTPTPWSIVPGSASTAMAGLSWLATSRTPVTAPTTTPGTTVFQ